MSKGLAGLLCSATGQANAMSRTRSARTVAILPHYGIPFTMGPTSTIDFDCKSGEEIEIELRDPEEIKSKWYAEPMAPASVKCYNPAFDVTNHDLIAGIVTEHGVLRAPYTESIAALKKTIESEA